MSKEYLEAFEILLQHIETEADWSDYEKVKNAHKIVEQALQRLESIDNANPSEALECLEEIRERFSDDSKGNNSWGFKISQELNTIKQALLKAQENARSEEILQKYYQEGITLDSVRALKLRVQALEKDLDDQRELAKYYLEEQDKENAELKVKVQKEHNALEIIKNKEVDIHLLKACISCFTDALYAYNSEIKKLHSNHKDYQNKPLRFYQLTQEEFNLLKEVLE